MEPLLLPGDRIYAERLGKSSPTYYRGALVLLQDPEVPERILLKRVSGVPGDMVVRGPEGYALGVRSDSLDVPGLTYREIHPHELFVTGDNARVSRDSRRFGPIDRSTIVGRVWFRYAPESRRGPLV